MPRVGIRELKNDASEIIRAVREEQAEYIVTYRGEPVAVILPVAAGMRPTLEARIVAEARRHTEYWTKLDELAAEIDAAWTSDKGAVEAVDEQRRDL